MNVRFWKHIIFLPVFISLFCMWRLSLKKIAETQGSNSTILAGNQVDHINISSYNFIYLTVAVHLKVLSGFMKLMNISYLLLHLLTEPLIYKSNKSYL